MRLGAVFRAVRVHRGSRQRDVAERAGTSPSTISRIERGHVGTLALDTLLAVAIALEIRIDFVPRWRGGDLDRMLGAGHGRMHEQMARLLRRYAPWIAVPEVSFSVYGERGVIDILAFHPGRRQLLVIELKTQLVDVQELLSAVDRYRRLAPRLAADRGWAVSNVSTWVVMRDTTTNRRRFAVHATVLRAALPDDGRMLRRWLRDPAGRLAALSFLADAHPGTTRASSTGQHRVRRPRPRSGQPPEPGQIAAIAAIDAIQPPNGPPMTI
ncbi:MAG: helix-turn-helix transcriptional regulator [Chloroflexota bacterium]